MAEFKTAEQYVVAKLEMTEMELDNTKMEHKTEMAKTLRELAELKVELKGAYEILNTFRNFITTRESEYFGTVLDVSGSIYTKDHPEEAARIMEYFDMRPEEKDDE